MHSAICHFCLIKTNFELRTWPVSNTNIYILYLVIPLVAIHRYQPIKFHSVSHPYLRRKWTKNEPTLRAEEKWETSSCVTAEVIMWEAGEAQYWDCTGVIGAVRKYSSQPSPYCPLLSSFSHMCLQPRLSLLFCVQSYRCVCFFLCLCAQSDCIIQWALEEGDADGWTMTFPSFSAFSLLVGRSPVVCPSSVREGASPVL